MGIVDDLLAEATESCWKCHGTGRENGNLTFMPCRGCKGGGKLLTEEGERLMEGLEPHLRALFATADHTHTVT